MTCFFPNFSSPLLHLLSSFPFLGVVSLSQALCSSDDYSNSLLHLDLSKNPGVLSGEDATVRTTTNKSKQYHAESLWKMCNKNIFFSQRVWIILQTLCIYLSELTLWTHSRTPALMFLVFCGTNFFQYTVPLTASCKVSCCIILLPVHYAVLYTVLFRWVLHPLSGKL